MFDGNSRVQAAAANTGGLKRGSSVQSPDTLASDRDLDKICEATVIGAIVNVGRNRQPPRRHSRASSRLPYKSFILLVSATKKDTYYTSADCLPGSTPRSLVLWRSLASQT